MRVVLTARWAGRARPDGWVRAAVGRSWVGGSVIGAAEVPEGALGGLWGVRGRDPAHAGGRNVGVQFGGDDRGQPKRVRSMVRQALKSRSMPGW